jgi:hypothetical protein
VERLGTLRAQGNAIVVSTKQTVLMKERSKNAPYRFVDAAAEQLFELRYADAAAVDAFLANLSVLQRLCRESADRFEIEARVAEMLAHNEQQLVFDPGWLVNLSETPLFEAAADLVQPLFQSPGRLVVTNSRVYF